MKNRLHVHYLLFFFAFSIFASCKKDDKTSSTPTPTPALYSTVLGKWTVIRPSSGRVQHNIASKIQSPAELTSIEFLNDSTYVIVMGEDEVTTGTFAVTDSTSITLSGLGSLSEIKIADGKMDFKLFYNGSVLVLSANKAAEIPATEKTKLLCRTWLLTHELSGDSAYDNEGFGDPDKITILFSDAGTYLTQYIKQGVVTDAQLAHWKWHPTIPDAIVDLADDDTSDDNYLIITELTNSSFKFSYTWEDVDNNTSVTDRYVLIPYLHSGRVSQASMRKVVTSRHSSTHFLFGSHK